MKGKMCSFAKSHKKNSGTLTALNSIVGNRFYCLVDSNILAGMESYHIFAALTCNNEVN